MEINPIILRYPYDTYTKVWNKIKDKITHKDNRVNLKFFTAVQYNMDNIEDTTVNMIHWEFDIDWLKARVFDESAKLPYQMDEEIMQQAFVSKVILRNTGLFRLCDWLLIIAKVECDRMRNEGYNNSPPQPPPQI